MKIYFYIIIKHLFVMIPFIFMVGCQTPINTYEYKAKNNEIFNHKVLSQYDKITAGKKRVFFVGLGLWGGEAWSSNDIMSIRRVFGNIYANTEIIEFIFSNENIMMPDVHPSFDFDMYFRLSSLLSRHSRTDDIMVLAISSHGLEGMLSNKVGTSKQRNFNASHVISFLRAFNNIPKIVLISACRSGSFIETMRFSGLKNILVMTSARHDRNSFGCSVSSRNTWFVEALTDVYEKSFASGSIPNYVDLFHRVRSRVELLEGGKHLPSHPQIWISEDFHHGSYSD